MRRGGCIPLYCRADKLAGSNGCRQGQNNNAAHVLSFVLLGDRLDGLFPAEQASIILVCAPVVGEYFTTWQTHRTSRENFTTGCGH